MIPIFSSCGTKKISDDSFNVVDYNSARELAPIIRGLPTHLCDYTMFGILMWAGYFCNEYTMLTDKCAILRSIIPTGEFAGQAIYSYISSEDVSEQEHLELQSYAFSRDGELRFFPICHEESDYIINVLGRPDEFFDFGHWFDYIYSADELIYLSGKKFHGQKNQCNKFVAKNPDYNLSDILASDIDDIKAFMNELDHSEKSEMGIYEHNAVFDVLDHYEILDSHGLVLRVEGRVVAFTIGEFRGDMLYVHIEKAFSNVPGAYAFIGNSFVKYMREKFPTLLYVNREDDADDPGLRYAKQSLHPIKLIDKWMMVYKKK